MRFLDGVFADLRAGKNLEVYLTLVVALVLLILDIFGFASTEALAAGTLATLALLAFSTLKNREQMQRLAEAAEQGMSGRLGADDFFWDEDRLGQDDFKDADFIGVVGVTLSRTVRTHSLVFEDRLRDEAHVRFMVIDPESPAPLQAIRRSQGVPSQSFYKSLLQPTIENVCMLATSASSRGTVELGLLPYIPSFGLVLIDPDRPHGRIIVEVYQHKTPAFSPTFELRNTQQDARWYSFFREQFDLLWDSCGKRRAAGEAIKNFGPGSPSACPPPDETPRS